MRDFHVVRRHAYRCLVRFGLAIVIALSAASQGSAAGWMSHSSALLDLKNDGPRRETPHRLTATGTEAATIQILAAGNTTPASLTFAAQEGGPPPAALWYCVANTGEALLTWQASPDAPWLHLDLTAFDTLPHDQNCGHASVTLDGLPAGTHHATVTVTAPGAPNSPQVLPVTLAVAGAPKIAVSPTALSFEASEGGPNPPDQMIAVTNAGGGSLAWSLTDNRGWIVSSISGQTIAVSAKVGSRAPGTYRGTVTVTAPGATNSPLRIPVSLTVAAAPAASIGILAAGNTTPPSLTFAAQAGGPPPAALWYCIANTGDAAMQWQASPDAPWLHLDLTAFDTLPHDQNCGHASVTLDGLPAGTHHATVTVTAPGAPNSPQVLPVMMTVAPAAPTISLGPGSLLFDTQEGGPIPQGQTLTIGNAGGGALDWTASADAPWLTVAKTSPTTALATVLLDGLSPGSYEAQVVIAASSATNSPQIVPVTLSIQARPPTISVSQASLRFTGSTGGPDPDGAEVVVSNTGGGTLSWTASADRSWISVTTSDSSVSVHVSPGPLPAGTHSGSVSITAPDATNSPQVIPVALIVTEPPAIAASPASLSFSATQGGTAPSSQSVSVTNAGGGTLVWSVSTDQSWLDASRSGQTLVVQARPGSLESGSYTGALVVTAPDAVNSPQTIPVSLTVTPPPSAAFIGILAAGNTSPASLTFAAQAGGPPPAALWYCVANTGDAAMQWQASPDAPWLHLDLTAFDTLPHDQNCGHASVTLDGLPAGTHHATVTVTAPGAGNSPQALPVTLVLDGVSPTLALDRTSLSFVGTEGAADAPDQAVEIRNAGSGTLTWSADTAAAWLSVSPEAGTAGSVPDSLTLHVDLAALAVGTHTATVTIQSAEAANSPRAITVSVTVNPAATASATLAWEGNGESDLAGYHVYRSTIPGTFGAPIATVSPATTTYTDSALALNTTFFWVVTAFDSLGNESVHSNEVSKSIY